MNKPSLKTLTARAKRCIALGFILAFGMASLFSSCMDSEERFSKDYACQFVFYGDLHSVSALLRTMDNPGLYAIVTSYDRNGITYLNVSLNDGQPSETIPLTTAKEQHINYSAMGANRALIIGCSNFEGIKAWDRQCRHCLDNNSNVNFPLTFSNNGRNVECQKCGRSYVLETGSSADGVRLYEYHARYDINSKMLPVTNH